MDSYLSPISWDMSWIWDRYPSLEWGEKWKQMHKWRKFALFQMQEIADALWNCATVYTCWLINVLKVLQPSSFSLSSCDLQDFIVISCFVCFVRTKFKLQRANTGILKICWKQLLHRANISLGVHVTAKVWTSFPFSFLFSLNKIRFAKTQCEFRDYELGR